MKLKPLLIIALLFSVYTAGFSQAIRMEGTLNYFKTFNDNSFNTKGIGGRAGYFLSKKSFIYAGGDYLRPVNAKGEFPIRAYSNQTEPSTDEVTIQRRISLYQGYAGTRLYFMNPVKNKFAISLLGELGVMFGTNNIKKVGDFNKQKYFLEQESYEEGSKKTMVGILINFGPYLEYSLGNGYLFAEGQITLPASGADRLKKASQVPPAMFVKFGYSLAFNEGDE